MKVSANRITCELVLLVSVPFVESRNAAHHGLERKGDAASGGNERAEVAAGGEEGGTGFVKLREEEVGLGNLGFDQ